MVFGSVLSLASALSLCIHEPHNCVNKTSSLNPPPIIVHGHSNQTLMLGSSAILPCQATGRTLPSISWLKNGELLDYQDSALKSRLTQLPIGSLQVFDLKKTDTGVYTCRARNEDGESTWSASLTVEEHTNPTISFHRMPDISTLPSAAGMPTAQNLTENTVELKWSPPEKNGAGLIIGYLLQYYSPEMGQTWFNLPDYISGPHYIVKNLKTQHSYVFIVRAENSFGIGPPSPMSGLVRTRYNHQNGKGEPNYDEDLDKIKQRMIKEPLIKLEEIKTINSSAVKVAWKKRRAEAFIQGYYIKWRTLSSSAHNSIDSSWINVSRANIDSYIVNGLRPFTSYEFFVIPYYKNIQGLPSNSLDGSTDEAPPTVPPADVRIRMMNLTTLRISWSPPPPNGINGVLKGFQIVILGNGVKYNRNITTNERAGSVTLFHLVPGMTYGIKVAARSGAGVGVYHGLEPVTMNEATLREHIALLTSVSTGDRLLHLIRRPWFIAIAGVFIWIIFVAIVAFVWWRWRRSHARLGMPFIKINDGSVHLTARDALWMDHNNLNSAQRSLLLHGSVNNGTTCNAPPLYTQTPHQTDFCIDGQPAVNLIGTIDRSHSPHHYHYAALTTTGHPSAVSTFYASRHLMDDPSPYATTTLVTNDRHDWLKEHMLRCPTLPTNPVPPGPPPRFQESAKDKKFDRAFLAIRSPSFADPKQNIVYQSGSPPHTDTSYVQSSDGTGDSSNGRSKNSMTNLGHRSPPKQTLLDFIPPPPPGAPPSETGNEKVLLDSSEHYDAVSEALLFSQSPRYVHNQNNSNHINRHCNKPRANYRKDLVDYNARPKRDENLKSSLMMDKSDHSSSDAGDDSSERGDDVSFTNRDDARPTSECALRPFQPCMGISASTLVQSDGTSVKRSTGRLRSLPRNSKKDIV